MNVFMPAVPVDQMGDVVAELIGVDESTFSVREEARVEDACVRGDLYPADWDPETRTISSDVGHPGAKVSLTLPEGTTSREAVIALAAAIRTII